MLRDPQSDLENLVHFTINLDLNSMVEAFTESQLIAYRWIENEFNGNRQVFAAIFGLAGTGNLICRLDSLNWQSLKDWLSLN